MERGQTGLRKQSKVRGLLMTTDWPGSALRASERDMYRKKRNDLALKGKGSTGSHLTPSDNIK